MTKKSNGSKIEQIINKSLAGDVCNRRDKIRELNDQLRTRGRGGVTLMTDGIAGLGLEAVKQIITAIAAFDTFNDENDPWHEHDCGLVTVANVRVLWKIDYYDRSKRYLSPDPTDPKVTVRVMTIMRADEY
ncbi:MAG: DUF3768 domain-containing protein [Rhodobiaceae bacterium]|nr:DUF3768 domain-containing protein [Rhodobiaceae bacterium]